MTARRLAIVSVLAATLLLVSAAGVVTARTILRPTYARDGVMVALVIGSDAGWPYRPGDPLRGRADAIHLVAVSSAGRNATVVDIPRDSLIGGTKVNAHLATGGPDALVARLEEYTGLTIDYWVLTTFRGFENLTAGLGGVDVVVDQPMHDADSHSDFDPGPTRVQGANALAYARDRHSLPDGDFGRTRHQGDLLVAIHRRVSAQADDLPALVSLVGLMSRSTVSNVPRADLLPLVLLAADIAPEDVEHVALSGTTGTRDGASVVYLEPGDAFTRIRDGMVGPDQ